MSDSGSVIRSRQRGGYRPALPIRLGPLHQRPLRILALTKWMFGFPGYLWPWQAFFIGAAALSWYFLTPDLAKMKDFSINWLGVLLIRNCTILIVFTGLWHLRLYVQKAQGVDYKYNSRWLSADDPTFLFRNQLRDNIFWNVFSAVPIWTVYEAVTYWLQENGRAPTVTWHAHPMYFVLLAALTPTWLNIHFYFTHRLLHWAPLYKAVHSIHHKNINFGPWSGLAMHPIEHLVYFSAIALYWLVPAHPLHAIFLLQQVALGPTLTHHGFGRLSLGTTYSLNTDHYMHYLHHKYVKVNFSTDIGLVPLDKWFGTFYDGSDEAHAALKKRSRIERSEVTK
jgi:sterol desaturase/sphingolipid hydroxylase (fatty acid hydroxylase superfamily)